jgi:membrane-bound ClpP family serine protease
VSFTIGLILSMIYLEGPWRFLVLIPLAAWEGFEIWLFFRWRNVRSITGAESLVGSIGTATTPLNPEGQVRVRGQVWQATSSEDVPKDAKVRIVEVEGLRLRVEPAPEVYRVEAADPEASRAPGP